MSDLKLQYTEDHLQVVDEQGNVLEEVHRDSPDAEELVADFSGEGWWAEDAKQAIRDELRIKHFANLRAVEKRPPIIPEDEYLVEDIMPTRELYIWAGESGAGKSTLLYDFINAWQHEQPVWGKKTFWRPYVIISRDRSVRGIRRTLKRIGLNPALFQLDTSKGWSGKKLAEHIKALKKKNPDMEVFFVEGIHVGAEEGNDYGSTSNFLQGLNDLCDELNITIIGTTHTSKTFAKGAFRRMSRATAR